MRTHIEEYEDTYIDPYRERLEQLYACAATSRALYIQEHEGTYIGA
jgi:hypothetical protein